MRLVDMATPRFPNALAALLISVAALAVWRSLPEPAPSFIDGAPASVAASAALGWSQGHCGNKLELADGAPRLMMDDLLRLSARFDADRDANGIDAACRRALTEAEIVANPAAAARGPDEIALSN